MDITWFGWAAIALTVLPVAALAYGLVAVDRRQFVLIQQNLARAGVDDAAPTHGTRSFAGLARRLTPGTYETRLDRLLAYAGRPTAWPLDRLLTVKPLAAFAGFVLGGLVVIGSPAPSTVAGWLLLTAFAYFLPDLLVLNASIKRQQAILLELPNVLDQLLIAVEAGLGLEQAMSRVAVGSSPMAQEMGRTLQEMQVGRSRREAYEALAERSTVADLRSFVRAVTQADRYGIGISRVLAAQAAQMRVKRRQRAEEKAMKLPVKILFPLLFFIFPTIFIVVMGPAVINILESPLFGG
ncbi:type II secretion system F family protein [Zhihengliuella halotolerans]|uniref:type II secretion system F family protein n=1 Tax=Zhihengliuella halotolerans TaxID=370736 RepID=UPI000C800C9A|nr:type II secretion system F family protein [Zhihengliuella halotolerans]